MPSMAYISPAHAHEPRCVHSCHAGTYAFTTTRPAMCFARRSRDTPGGGEAVQTHQVPCHAHSRVQLLDEGRGSWCRPGSIVVGHCKSALLHAGKTRMHARTSHAHTATHSMRLGISRLVEFINGILYAATAVPDCFASVVVWHKPRQTL